MTAGEKGRRLVVVVMVVVVVVVVVEWIRQRGTGELVDRIGDGGDCNGACSCC